MRIIVIGSNGQIGWELMRALPASHEIIGLDRSRIDLLSPENVRGTLRELNPAMIINAAGYTAVDRAEAEPDLAMAINGTAVGVIGEEAARLNALVVHYSTDYVFDGTKRTPYLPVDQTNPLSVYGRSKLAGEIALNQSAAKAIILRTSWVYGARGSNFLLTILRLARSKPELRIVNDQTGSPTWSRSIAQATAQIAEQIIQSGRRDVFQSGADRIFHLTAAGSTTWFEYAKRIVKLANVNPCPKLKATSTSEFNAAAPRPAYSVLDCSSTEAVFGVRLGDWRATLDEVMAEAAAAAQ